MNGDQLKVRIAELEAEVATLRQQASSDMVAQREGEIESLERICAATYQLAGALNAPVRFLDALSDPLSATQAQIDALLPLVGAERISVTGLPGEVDLLPCPFCGGDAQTDFIEGESYLIECYSRCAKTGSQDCEQDAVTAWNRRSRPATWKRKTACKPA
jgi:Lar family restriction alleviation protein